MDDDPCRRFFLEPHQLLQRRYEVLRAFFVEQRPQAEIAGQFGLSPATVQSLVRDFRAQIRHDQVTPFLSNRTSAGPAATRGRRRLCNPRRRLSVTAVKSASSQGDVCGRALPASSCSCLCLRVWALTAWYAEPVIPAHG